MGDSRPRAGLDALRAAHQVSKRRCAVGCRAAGGVSRRAHRAAPRPEGNPAAARREGGSPKENAASSILGVLQQKARYRNGAGLVRSLVPPTRIELVLPP